jgi:AcrR family transcriptional regulator
MAASADISAGPGAAVAPPRRRMPAANRREAILAAALDVFADGGYHETSVEVVAARAGVSKALIYEHFDSKRELHRALLERYVHELLARVVEASAVADPGEARLLAGLDAFLAFVEERRDAWRFVFRNVGDVEIADALARLRGEVAGAIASLMAADAPPGWADDPVLGREIEMIAEEITGAIQALANWWDEHRDVPRERVTQSIMDFAWIGLERLGEGRRWAG